MVKEHRVICPLVNRDAHVAPEILRVVCKVLAKHTFAGSVEAAAHEVPSDFFFANSSPIIPGRFFLIKERNDDGALGRGSYTNAGDNGVFSFDVHGQKGAGKNVVLPKCLKILDRRTEMEIALWPPYPLEHGLPLRLHEVEEEDWFLTYLGENGAGVKNGDNFGGAARRQTYCDSAASELEFRLVR